MTPEIQLEQLLHYTIGAYELIPQVQEQRKKTYTQAILPYGSALYTGVLQAAGYILLKPWTLCYIDIQTDQEDLLVQKTGTFWPILGTKYTISPLDKQLPQSNKRKKTDIEKCLWQLWFHHIIQGVQEIHWISIRAKLTAKEHDQVCSYIKKKKKINCIRLANLASENKDSDSADMAKRKKGSTNKDHKIFQLFANINTKQDIIAYTREDFSKEKNRKSGFTCIVA